MNLFCLFTYSFSMLIHSLVLKVQVTKTKYKQKKKKKIGKISDQKDQKKTL